VKRPAAKKLTEAEVRIDRLADVFWKRAMAIVNEQLNQEDAERQTAEQQEQRKCQKSDIGARSAGAANVIGRCH
jgi:hypothetical protein